MLTHMYTYTYTALCMHLYRYISICVFTFDTETSYISHVNNFMCYVMYIQVCEIYVFNVKTQCVINT